MESIENFQSNIILNIIMRRRTQQTIVPIGSVEKDE